MHYWHRIYTPPHHFGMNKISSCKFIGGTGEGVFLIAMEMVPSAEVMSVGPSEMETTISTEALPTAVPKELPVDIFRADEVPRLR